MKQSIKTGISMAIAATLSLSMSACGGSGSDSSSATTLSGIAIDGYLQKAKVCIDTNNNSKCDSSEPSATTDDSGAYSLTTSLTNLAQYNILVEAIAGETVDSDTPNSPVAQAFFLKAPANEPDIVSPMTTLVLNNLELNATLTKTDAIAQLKRDLNVSDSVDILGDYIAAKASNDTNVSAIYGKIHTVARVVTKTIANTIASNVNITEANYNASTKVMLEDISKKVAEIEQETQKPTFNEDSYTVAVEVNSTKIAEVEQELNDDTPSETTTQVQNNLVFESLLKSNQLYDFFFDGHLNFGKFGFGQPYTNSYEGILFETSILSLGLDFSNNDYLWRQYFMLDGEERSIDFYRYGYGDFDANITIDPTSHSIIQESVYGIYTSDVNEVQDISNQKIPAILGLIEPDYADMYADRNISEAQQPQFQTGSKLIKVTSTRTTNYNTTGETLLTKICTVTDTGVERCSDYATSAGTYDTTIVRYYLNQEAYQSIKDANLSTIEAFDAQPW